MDLNEVSRNWLKEIGLIDEDGQVISENPHSISFCYREIKTVPLFLEDFTNNITYLNLSHNQLTNIENLRNFVKLNHLVLDNNELDDSAKFPVLYTLQTLEMNNNQFKNISSLTKKLSKSYPLLNYLSLLGNKACPSDILGSQNSKDDYQKYRRAVVKQLDNLKFLDFKTVDETDGRLPKRKSVDAKKRHREVQETDERLEESSENYKTEKRDTQVKEMTFRYSGKNSEGNRFIKNKDL